MTLNKAKYEATILYLGQKLGGKIEGKKKLAKLLYFADFDHFEKTGHSITGDIYKKLPMGPFPSALQKITSEMKTGQKLNIEKIEKWPGYITEVYKIQQQPNSKVLDSDELITLDRIANKYGQLSGKQLEDLSHAEAPYAASDLNEIIPYELAYYRGTDFQPV